MGPKARRYKDKAKAERYVSKLTQFTGEIQDQIATGQIKNIDEIEVQVEAQIEDYFKFKERRFIKGEERLELYARRIIEEINKKYKLNLNFETDVKTERKKTVTIQGSNQV